MPLYRHNPGDPNTLARTVMNREVSYDFLARQRTRFDFLGDLKHIKCPTLVMGGEDDPVTPIADSEHRGRTAARASSIREICRLRPRDRLGCARAVSGGRPRFSQSVADPSKA